MVVLKVPLVKQRINSHYCGIFCVYMVLKYKGYNISLEELLKKIKIKKSTVARGPTIVKTLKEMGIKAEMIIYAPYIFKSLEMDEIRKIGEKFKRDFVGIYAKKLMEIMKLVKIRRITTFLIKNFLREGIPVITSVNSSILRNKKYGKLMLHYIVIRGFKGDYFIINDPHPKFGGKLKIHRDILLASIYSRKIPELVIIK